ncbi:MAG: hypothetical protein QM731_07755 [Chitinophagaceae bacterium]
MSVPFSTIGDITPAPPSGDTTPPASSGETTNKAEKQPSDYKWAFVFGCISLALLVATLIAIRNLTPDQRQSFKVVLALGAAGVAAAIPGITSLKYKGSWSAGGAIVIFFVVLNLPVIASEFHLTVYPLNSKEEPVLLPDKSLRIALGAGYKDGESNSGGTIKFNDVPGNYTSNDSVHLVLTPETNWTFENGRKSIYMKLQELSMNIKLLPDKNHFVIAGNLKYLDKYLSSAKIVDIEREGDSTITNAFGHFKLELDPADAREYVNIAVELPKGKQATLSIKMGDQFYGKNIQIRDAK